MQNIVLTPADLLTVTGSAGLTAVLIQLFIKPLLANMVEDKKLEERWLSLTVNLSSFVVSGLLVFLGAFALGEVSRVTVVQGVITTILSASLAVGGYEVSKNVVKVLK